MVHQGHLDCGFLGIKLNLVVIISFVIVVVSIRSLFGTLWLGKQLAILHNAIL
jgi:hypothetical protein